MEVILGTVQFGLPYGINNQSGQPTESEVFNILDNASKNGVQHLDTASAYGTSEQLIGKYLKTHPKSFRILSKFSSDPAQELNKSCQLLGVNSIELYSLHKAELLSEQKIKTALLQLKNSGAINNIGVSIYTSAELEKAAQCDWVDVIQTPFNLFDHWGVRGKAIQYAKKQNKKIHVRSVYLQGIFYADPTTLSPKLYDLKIPLQNLRQIAQEEKVKMSELALRYVCSFTEIDAVIIGVDSKKQLEENLSVSQSPLNDSTINKVHQIKISNLTTLDPRTWN